MFCKILFTYILSQVKLTYVLETNFRCYLGGRSCMKRPLNCWLYSVLLISSQLCSLCEIL